MKRIFTILISALLTASAAFAQAPTENKTADTVAMPTATEKKTVDTVAMPTADETAYATGVYFASVIMNGKEQSPGGKELKMELIMQGLKDHLETKSAKLTPEEAFAKMNTFFTAKQKEEEQAIKKASEDFLAENAKKEGVQTTKSGLQYMIITEGKGSKPTVEDTVVVHYKGMLIDGTEFDSSYKLDEPARFNPLQVIPGWTEGLCLLSEGTKARLFVPANLAYGERGIGNRIPPHSALIFDIEMLKVIKGEPIPVAKAKTAKSLAETQAEQKEAKKGQSEKKLKNTEKH